MNTNQKGCFAEYRFATMAMKNGFNVSMPLLDASPYDCLLERGGEIFKIQIKFMSRSKKYFNRNDDNKSEVRIMNRKYEKNEVDYFAVWHDTYKGFFIIENKEQRSFSVSLSDRHKQNFNNFAKIS